MKLIKYVLIFSCVIFNVHPQCLAQTTAKNKKEARQFIQEGDELLGLNYRGALEKYLGAIGQEEFNADLNFKIGICYMNTVDKVKAIPYLEKAKELEPKVSPEIDFLLGRAYQLNYEFDKAGKSYSNYKRTLSSEDYKKREISGLIIYLILINRAWSDRPDIKNGYAEINNIGKIIMKRQTECRDGKRIYKKPVPDMKIENMGTNINSDYADYAPVISADEMVMYFTSRRSGSTGGQKDLLEGLFYEDIYMSVNIAGTWQPPINMGAPINSDIHESAIGLSADGQTMFLFKVDAKHGGDIYISKLIGDNWSEPERMPKGINSKAYEYSVSLSADERVLYFVSDRKDGFGGRDIYMSRKMPDGAWSEPENLGRSINTLYDEDGVFFHPDGKTLYFSSKGHKGMGGYDIYKTINTRGIWSRPKNLGYPINTPDDDIYFVLSANGERGYFTSAKEGSKDIYVIHFPKDSVVQELTLLTGHISDEKTKEFLKAQIVVEDLAKKELVGKYTSNVKTGKYLVALPSGRNYGISVTKEGYLFHSENLNIPLSEKFQKVEKDIALKKLEVGSKIVLNNIFFDFDQATLRTESEAELDRLYLLLVDNASMKVEISGHTDNKGSSEYNRVLSDKRANAVVEYLVTAGISEGSLIAKGYGDISPIAPNENEDGSDNPEGRQMNRRTEFEVIEN